MREVQRGLGRQGKYNETVCMPEVIACQLCISCLKRENKSTEGKRKIGKGYYCSVHGDIIETQVLEGEIREFLTNPQKRSKEGLGAFMAVCGEYIKVCGKDALRAKIDEIKPPPPEVAHYAQKEETVQVEREFYKQ